MWAARAAPYEKGTETELVGTGPILDREAARAAPYEKGTETGHRCAVPRTCRTGRARGPL